MISSSDTMTIDDTRDSAAQVNKARAVSPAAASSRVAFLALSSVFSNVSESKAEQEVLQTLEVPSRCRNHLSTEGSSHLWPARCGCRSRKLDCLSPLHATPLPGYKAVAWSQ